MAPNALSLQLPPSSQHYAWHAGPMQKACHQLMRAASWWPWVASNLSALTRQDPALGISVPKPELMFACIRDGNILQMSL